MVKGQSGSTVLGSDHRAPLKGLGLSGPADDCWVGDIGSSGLLAVTCRSLAALILFHLQKGADTGTADGLRTILACVSWHDETQRTSDNEMY